MELPNRIFHSLFIEIQEKMFTEQGKKELTGERIGNAIAEGVGL